MPSPRGELEARGCPSHPLAPRGPFPLFGEPSPRFPLPQAFLGVTPDGGAQGVNFCTQKSPPGRLGVGWGIWDAGIRTPIRLRARRMLNRRASYLSVPFPRLLVGGGWPQRVPVREPGMEIGCGMCAWVAGRGRKDLFVQVFSGPPGKSLACPSATCCCCCF